MLTEKVKDCLKLAGFGKQIERIEAGLCPICAKPTSTPDDNGLCVDCQVKLI